MLSSVPFYIIFWGFFASFLPVDIPTIALLHLCVCMYICEVSLFSHLFVYMCRNVYLHVYMEVWGNYWGTEVMSQPASKSIYIYWSELVVFCVSCIFWLQYFILINFKIMNFQLYSYSLLILSTQVNLL